MAIKRFALSAKGAVEPSSRLARESTHDQEGLLARAGVLSRAMEGRRNL
jgi:hypothetical protein